MTTTKRKKAAPLTEVTVRLTGPSLSSVLKRITDPSTDELIATRKERDNANAALATLFEQSKILEASNLEHSNMLAEANRQIADLERRIRAGIGMLDTAPDPRPTWLPIAMGYLQDVMRPAIWTHVCPSSLTNGRETTVTLTELEQCTCGRRKA